MQRAQLSSCIAVPVTIPARGPGPWHPRHEGAPVEDEPLEGADVPPDLLLLGREGRPEAEAGRAEAGRERVCLRRDVAGEVGERLEGVLVLGLRGRRRR